MCIRDRVQLFHAGTTDVDGKVVTAGGRVLCVTALGDNVKQAHKHAYDALLGICLLYTSRCV